MHLPERKKYYAYEMGKYRMWVVCEVVGYAGAWYKNEMDAIKFAHYANKRAGEDHAENHRQTGAYGN